jgi:hypothetical protein
MMLIAAVGYGKYCFFPVSTTTRYQHRKDSWTGRSVFSSPYRDGVTHNDPISHAVHHRHIVHKVCNPLPTSGTLFLKRHGIYLPSLR